MSLQHHKDVDTSVDAHHSHSPRFLTTGAHTILSMTCSDGIWNGAKDDGEGVREEGDQRIVDLALQAVWKRKIVFWKESWKESELERKKDTKVAKVAKLGEEPIAEGQWQESKHKGGKWWQGRNQSMLDVWQDKPHCSVVSMG